MNINKLKELKAQGYTHITSVIKQCYTTIYLHPVSIDVLIANGGKWIGCRKGVGKYIRGIGYTITELNKLGYKTYPRSMIGK